MPNPTGEPESGPSMRASTRLLANGRGHPAAHEPGPPTAVAAHVLLNDVSVVLLGAATLDESWDLLSVAERRTLAARVHVHMVDVAERVKAFVREPTAPLESRR